MVDYDGIIKEIDGINPANNEDGVMQSYIAERLVEIQSELSSVDAADRNDDHQLAWLGLYDKANALISELAGQSFEGISKEQLDAYESLISNFVSHTGEEYSGVAAQLKGKLDARRETLEAESQEEILNERVAAATEINEDDDIKDTVLDTDKQEFLASINDENKALITDRFNKIDEAADEMGDVFAQPQKENGDDKFAGLRNFYDNIWIDRDPPEDENAQPGQDDLKKRQQLKERMQEMAKIMAIQDLVADSSIDGMTKEQIKERMEDAVKDNMTFLTYNMVANQSGFKVLETGQDVTKLSPKERQEYMGNLQSGYKEAFDNVNKALSGEKANPVSVGSPAINATMVPQYKESKKFAKEFQAKTGITKMLKRVKDFDAKMSKDHPHLWGFAKVTAISALTGPTGVMVYTGVTIAKQAKGLIKEYKQQKAEKGEEALSVGKFLKQNSGRMASMAISAGFASYTGISGIEGVSSLDFGAMAKSVLNNTGLLGNMTGSLLSGDALNNVSQSLSWDGIKNAAGNMVDKIANVSNIDASQVVEGLKNSYSPSRLTRLALSGLGVGIAKAHDAYTQAGDGNKWKAARKAFTAHLTGVLVGSALADTMTVANNVMDQSAIDLQKIEAAEKQFADELKAMDKLQYDMHVPEDYAQHFENEGHETPQPQPHHSTPHHNENTVVNNDVTQETIPASETEKTVELKVNGEDVDAKLGNTLEETLDNAREQYLQNNPEIDVDNDTVVIEGDAVNATIETQKEDIMQGEAVIGQETTIHREINTDEAQIKDDIQEVQTDTGQAKIMESEGRTDIDTNNNIPDGAKILNVTEFHNENQDLKLTEYEQDGKVYITDGNQTRLAPEGQSAEQRYQTWNNMLRETAAAGYDENGQAVVNEQATQEPKAAQVKGENAGAETETKGGVETKVNAGITPESLGDHYDTHDGLPPVYNGQEEAPQELAPAKKIEMLGHGQSLQGGRSSIADRLNAMKDGNSNYESFVANANSGFELAQQEQQQQHDAFLAEKAAYEATHSGYQDYSSSMQRLGLQNSSVLSHSEGLGTRSHNFNGDSASYNVYEQNEFRQANNGFALAHNDEIRLVTTDGKGNLEFKVAENGQTRLMTREEADKFCSEVKAAGARAAENGNNFNNELFKHIEDTKHVRDAQGVMKYGVVARGNTDGGTYVASNNRSSVRDIS